MSKTTHRVFTRIAVHNRLMSEEEADALLQEVGDPEQAIQQLVERGVLNEKTAAQFLAVYRKKLDKVFAEQLEGLDEPLAIDEPAAPIDEPAVEPATEPEPPAAEESEEPAAERVTEPVAAVSEDEPAECKPLPEAGLGLVHHFLEEGCSMGASDLHLKANMPPVVRMLGELKTLPYPPIPSEVCEQSLLDVLDDGQRDQFLKTHDLDFCYDGDRLGRFRTNYLSEHRGMDAVFRMIPTKVPTFDELGLPEQVRRFTEYRVGVVLVTRPKGCGKTTTLAAMVDVINSTRAEHIITVEDPIEFVHPCKRGHVNQRQVGVHTKSFSNALRSALARRPM